MRLARSLRAIEAHISPATNFNLPLASPSPGPLSAFSELVQQQKFRPNPSQFAAVVALQQVYAGHAARDQPGSGVYLYGSVGVGKTTVADLLFDYLPAAVRIHYDDLVSLLNQEFQKHRKKIGGRQKQGSELLRYFARKTTNGALLGPVSFIFIDEMQIPTIQDCTLVIPYLAELKNRRCTLIFTSNKAPTELFHAPNLHREFQRLLARVIDGLDVCEVSGPDHRIAMGAAGLADPPTFAVHGGACFLAEWRKKTFEARCQS